MGNWNPGQPPPPGGYGPPGGAPPGGGGYGGPPGGPPGGPGGFGPPGAPPPGGYGAPPPGGYGGPPPGGFGPGPGPYQPPGFGAPPMMAPIQGSIALGFLAGFFGGCIGLILVQVLAKGPDTKKGSWFGFIAQMVVGGALRAIAR